MTSRIAQWLLAAALSGVILAHGVCAQDTADPAAPTPAAESGPASSDELTIDQSSIADKYAKLEQLLLKMAELEGLSNPKRAALLRQAAQQSTDRLTKTQLETIVKLLGRKQLARAIDGQTTVQTDLKALLDLLMSEDRSDRLKSEQQRIREYIKEVERLIRLEKSVQGQNEGGADAKRVAQEQGRIAGQTGDLARKIKENEEGEAGKPSEGEPKEGEPKEGQPNEGKPMEGQPDEGKPSEGKPSEGKPSEGKPSEGKPSEGKPSEGKPSEAADRVSEGALDPGRDDPSHRPVVVRCCLVRHTRSRLRRPVLRRGRGEPGDAEVGRLRDPQRHRRRQGADLVPHAHADEPSRLPVQGLRAHADHLQRHAEDRGHPAVARHRELQPGPHLHRAGQRPARLDAL
jgi:hypothetical protein